jgi:hypothetical protein
MKEIWIFSKDYLKSSDPYASSFSIGDNSIIKIYNHHQLKFNISQIEGTRPDLIINLSEPYGELVEIQEIVSVLKLAPILNYY